MKSMIGEEGTEQFTVTIRENGKLIRTQAIHDPFIYSTTTICISRWDLFKALFRKQFQVQIETSVHGSEGAQRAIMMLDPVALQEETREILESRKLSREASARDGNYNCFEVTQ